MACLFKDTIILRRRMSAASPALSPDLLRVGRSRRRRRRWSGDSFIDLINVTKELYSSRKVPERGGAVEGFPRALVSSYNRTSLLDWR